MNNEKRTEINELASKISRTKPYVYVQNTPGKKGRRKVLVGVISNGKLNIGMSVCGKKDNFSAEFGIDLALKRATEQPNLSFKLSENQNVRNAFFKMKNSLI